MEMLQEDVFCCPNDLTLESGEVLKGFELRYSAFGRLNEDKSNVVWVCHALTGSHDIGLWWDGLFGKGKLYDPERYFIVCANALGGCYGSTGPLSIKPGEGQPFYHDFPNITNRDIVRCLDLLREALELPSVHTLIGGSLGGQHALEWSIKCPEVFDHLILVATNAVHSPWGIAFNEAQRMAIEGDPTWQNKHENAGMVGMKAARATALLSYRNYKTFELTQSEDCDDKIDGFKGASYQRYQGEKLTERFNAFTYWVLSKAMDSHNVGRGRGGITTALKHIIANCLVVGVDTDLLFPVSEQEYLSTHINGASLKVITSDYGHDGFLVETKKLEKYIQLFYEEVKLKKEIT